MLLDGSWKAYLNGTHARGQEHLDALRELWKKSAASERKEIEVVGKDSKLQDFLNEMDWGE